MDYLQSLSDYQICLTEVVSDDREDIRSRLRSWADQSNINLILTTGGTGFGVRDNTPEVSLCLLSTDCCLIQSVQATLSVLEKQATALSIGMISRSLEKTPLAMLSRGVCGVRKQTLIVNLPGSPKGALENVESILPTLPHILKLLTGNSELPEHPILPTKPMSFGQSATLSKPGSGGCRCDSRDPDRETESPFPMVRIAEAERMVRGQCESLLSKAIVLPVREALGFACAEDLYAMGPYPSRACSLVDGYAVRSVDGPGVYELAQEGLVLTPSDTNGEISGMLRSGVVAAVTTGAPIPEDADAVVMIEDTKLTAEGKVEIRRVVTPWENVRPSGSDVAQGDPLLRIGEIVEVAHMALLISLGINQVCDRQYV